MWNTSRNEARSNKQQIVDNTSKNHRLKKCGDESDTENKKQAATMGKVNAGNDGKESKDLEFKIGGNGKRHAATHYNKVLNS